MNSLPPSLNLILASALVAFSAHVAPAQWTRVEGIPVGETYAVLSFGDTLYVSVDSIVYKSEHTGASWHGTGPIRDLKAPITALLRLGKSVLAGTMSDGVHETADGVVWTARSEGLVGLGATNISALAVRDSMVYVGTYGAGIFRTGISLTLPWTGFNAGIPSNVGWNIFSLTNLEVTLWAGGGSNAIVYRNDPTSTSWESITFAQFSPQGTSFLAATSMEGMIHAVGSQGLHRSTDGGATWSSFDPRVGLIDAGGFAHTPYGLYAFLGKVGATYLVRLNEDDSTWARVDAGPGETFAMAFAGNALFGGRFDGLWKYDLTPSDVDGEPGAALPGRIALGQNYPNPFNPSTTITYQLPTPSVVRLSVYDMLGREVSVLVDERNDAGVHAVKFDASNLSSGVYLYRMQAGGVIQTRRLVVVR